MPTEEKAIILYRCSTDRQDLLDQQETCRRFCVKKNFTIIDEIEEFDVSGYKVPLAEREGLLKILALAEEHAFTVLTVFMFDRLGRREDETPFLIQKLYECGVTVYIAKDETKVEAGTMENKLMNYFQSWVAQYESIKTSIRVKSKMAYLNDKGEYTGGIPPFGYELYSLNIVNEKGKMKHDIRINQSEAEIVRAIFNLCIKNNYGSGRIADYLNEHKYINRIDYKHNENKERIATICPFRNNSINRILRNSIYIGYQRYNVHNATQNGTVTNSKDDWKLKPKREDLVIIDEETFIKANKMLDQRKNSKKFDFDEENENVDEKIIPTKSQLLCTGLAFCQCGSKLKADYSVKKYTRKSDGKVTIMKTLRYKCINSRDNKQNHIGINKYSGKKFDALVEKAIFHVLDSINIDDANSKINEYKDNNVKKYEKELQNLNSEKEQCYLRVNLYQKQLDTLIVQEESEQKQYTFNILLQNMKRNEEKINEINQTIQEINDQLKNSKTDMVNMNQFIDKCKYMRDNWDNSSIDEKKAMLYNFVSKIIFYDNEIQLIVKMPLYESIETVDDSAINATNPTPLVIQIQDKFKYISLIRKRSEQYCEMLIKEKIA